MQIEKYTVEQFLFLPEEKRNEMTAIYNLVTFDVDCKTWTFEAVKETQYQLKRQLDYKTMIEIVNRQIKGSLFEIDAHVFFGTFNGIQKSILEITAAHLPRGMGKITRQKVRQMAHASPENAHGMYGKYSSHSQSLQHGGSKQ